MEEYKDPKPNELWKIKGRLNNLVTGVSGDNLSPAGHTLCNAYALVLKKLHRFSDTLTNENEKTQLLEILTAIETMPADVVKMMKPMPKFIPKKVGKLHEIRNRIRAMGSSFKRAIRWSEIRRRFTKTTTRY